MSKSKGGAKNDGGKLTVTVISANNYSRAEAYVTVTSSFNNQKFKTKVAKKGQTANWNQEFPFYTSKPEGKLSFLLYEKTAVWKSDELIGEVVFDIGSLSNGKPDEREHTLAREPKKKTGPAGTLKIKLHFPMPEPTPGSASAAATPTKSKSITDLYVIGEELGRGGFSIVKKGKNKASGEPVAIKIIEKKTPGPEELQLLHREIDIMSKLHHKNIIALEEVFEEDENIYLVLELVTGGELFDQIVSRGTYSERDAANTIRQILEAVAYMHDNGIAHRDLKPENLLCSGPDSNVIKVTDFGLSKDFGKASLKTSCGTPDYVAPEVLKGNPYDNSVDIWSIGVICYILLCGFPPFYGNTDQQIFEKIMKATYDFPSPDWDDITDDAKEFIQAILVLEPHERPTALECLQAPWIVSQAPSKTITHMDSFRGGLTEYNKKRKA